MKDYLLIPENPEQACTIKNDPDTCAMLATVPEECQGIILKAAAIILAGYDPEKRMKAVSRIIEYATPALEVEPAADKAIWSTKEKLRLGRDWVVE